jgi:hypothetical protein
VSRSKRLIKVSLLVTAAVVCLCACGSSQAQDAFASPESAIRAYLNVPTARWRDRVAMIADPDSQALMEKVYTPDIQTTVTMQVTRLSGATDPKAYLEIGSTKDCYAHEVHNGTESTTRFAVTHTNKGYQVNWRRTFSAKLFHKSLWIDGAFAKDESRPEITLKDVRFTPEKYRGKPVKLLSLQYLKLLEISNYKDNVGEPLPAFWWEKNGQIKMLDESLKPVLGAKVRDGAKDREQLYAQARQRHFEVRPWQRVGFRDRYGTNSDTVFFQKPDFIQQFMEMKESQLINVTGTVLPLGGWAEGQYAFFIQHIEILKDTASDLVKE